MRTETYNYLRQHSVQQLSDLNADLVVWAADPVGVGTTLTVGFTTTAGYLSENENIEFLIDRLHKIRVQTDIIAKLDELHGA